MPIMLIKYINYTKHNSSQSELSREHDLYPQSLEVVLMNELYILYKYSYKL